MDDKIREIFDNLRNDPRMMPHVEYGCQLRAVMISKELFKNGYKPTYLWLFSHAAQKNYLLFKDSKNNSTEIYNKHVAVGVHIQKELIVLDCLLDQPLEFVDWLQKFNYVEYKYTQKTGYKVLRTVDIPLNDVVDISFNMSKKKIFNIKSVKDFDFDEFAEIMEKWKISDNTIILRQKFFAALDLFFSNERQS